MINLKTIKIYLSPYIDKVHDKVKNLSGEPYISKRYITVPSKKNQNVPMVSKKTGKAFLKRSNQYIYWKKIVMPMLALEREKLLSNGIDTINRAKVKIVFYFPDVIARDLSNKTDSIMDALVDAEILLDDQVAVVNQLLPEGYICRDRPRTEIYLTIIPTDHPEYNIDKTNYDKLKKIKEEERKKRIQWRKS